MTALGLGGRIRAARESKGLSRPALAALAALTRVTIWEIEVAGHEPKETTLYRLAEALGTTVAALRNPPPPTTPASHAPDRWPGPWRPA